MSDSTTLIPFDTNDGNGWNAGVGGAVGAALGSWFFGNGGFGGWNGNRFGNGQIAADALVVDNLSNISNQVAGVNTTILESQANQNQSLCSGFAGVNSNISTTAAQTQQGLCQGFNNLGMTVQSTAAQTQQGLAQGFGSVTSAIDNSTCQVRYDNLSNVNALQRSLDSCCCATQQAISKGFGDLALENCHNTGSIVNAIAADGIATRELINKNYISDLQTQLCDAKSKISSLESQQYTSGLIAAQSAVFDQKLSNAVSTIITHIPKTTTTTTTPAA